MKLDDREWKAFKIEDIFIISPGKRLEKRNMIDGNRPFIGASDSNNGVITMVACAKHSITLILVYSLMTSKGFT